MSDIQEVKLEDAARLHSKKYNDVTSARHLNNEIRFSFHNHRFILDAWKEGRAVDLRNVPKVKDEPILVIGSGPTLNPEWEHIKKWKGAIIVSSSQASTCIYHGVDPDYIVCLDPDTHPGEFQVDTWKGRKAAIVIHPGVNPKLLEFWKGKICLFRKMQPQTPFFANAQRVGYQTLGGMDDELEYRYSNEGMEDLIAAEIPMLACVLSAQICIAKQLGYNKQFLIGADLSYPKDVDRFDRWDYLNGAWKETKSGNTITVREGSKMGRADPCIRVDGLLTSRMMVFYLHQVVTAWRITECDIINTSYEGLGRMFPFQPMKKVVAKQGAVKGLGIKAIRLASEQYLARQNIYFITVGEHSVMPHEFRDPITEIPTMLHHVKASLAQQGKGDDLDIDANMKRFKKLFAKVVSSAGEPPRAVVPGGGQTVVGGSAETVMSTGTIVRDGATRLKEIADAYEGGA